MSWNTKPQRASLPPQYRKIQPGFSPQYAANQLSTTSQSSFSCLPSNQEACMYLSNSNTVSQPLPNVRNYNVPLQIPASNMPNRTVVASQTLERTVYTNTKGPMKPNHNLQVTSGVVQNLRWKSLMMDSTPSQMEATVSRQSHFGTNPANSHALQSQCAASDTYSVQLQVTQDSSRVPVALQRSQGLNQSLSNQQVDWAQQHASDELTYPGYRPLPKQHSYSAQSFMQDPSIHKKILMSSPPSQITHNQLPTSVQSNQATAVYQYAVQSSARPPPAYNCRYGSQPLQNAQHVTKRLSVEALQSPEIHSSEVKKDFFPGFQQQWQSTNENVIPFGNFCDVKDASVKHPFIEPARSVDGVQTLSQNNQEKKIDSYNPTSNQGPDPAVTKEKLARDIKSLIEMKKKFSELARKIKINKDLLMAAGCKPSNSLSSEPAQHPEFAVKEIAPKGHCSTELVKTCLNLWKNQPSKMTEEKASKSAEEKQVNESLTNTSAGISKPLEVPIQNPCSVERNLQSKTVNVLQEAALSMLVQNYEPSCANVTKGTELQIAVVSPLILSNVIKEITPGALPETVYPIIKEGSICSLQNQQAENAAVTTALKVDVIKPVMSSTTSAKVFPLIQKEKQNEPNNGNAQNTPSIHEEQHCQMNGPQSSSKSKDRTLVAGDLLQIEDICSLVEGDVSYNSKIAKMFNSSPLEKVEPQKFSLPNEQVISTGHQEEQVEQASESKDMGLQNDECIRCTDFPCEIDTVRREEPPKLVGTSSSDPVEPGILPESNLEKTTKNEGMAKNTCCSPAAVLQDFNSGDIDTSGNDTARGPTASEIPNDNTSVLYLHDQLSELLKEFPYGIDDLNTYKSFVNQKKMGQIPEDQTGGKISCDSKGPSDQIKITILSSEQMKELFPEQDEPSEGDRPPPPKVDKLAEPQKEKHIAEVGSQCDPQKQEEGESPDSVGDTEKIHCCALGWLAMIYEGVPKCRCNAVEEDKREEQSAPVESSGCKQGPKTSDADVTVKLDGVLDKPKTPLTAAAEKTHLPKIHGNNIKDASKTRKDSAKRRRQEPPGEVPPKWKSSDKKDTSETKQGASANTGQAVTGQFSSKCDEPDPLQRNKKVKLKFHEVKFQSGDKMTLSDQTSQEGLQKKHASQNSYPLTPKTSLFPNTGLHRENDSFVQSSSQEKKKLKFKESSPQEGHLEKRKIDQGERPGLEIKKKKCDEQEQNKNAGVTCKLCNTLPNPNEKAIAKENSTSNAKSLDIKDTRVTATVREKTASQMKSADSKDISERASVKDKAVSLAKSSDIQDGSCKLKKVITLQEYFQRKKQKEVMAKTAMKTCLENVSGNSASSGFAQLHAQPESCRKSNGKGGSSIETSKDSSNVYTNCGKNLKAHPPEESKTCSLSRPVEGRADAKQLIKTKLDKTLSNVSNEVSSQVKEQRKSYLNRLSFRCTERESICLTTLNSSPAKLGKDKKSSEHKPKASFPGKDSSVKPSMLEFKLCPDVLLKNTNSVEDKYDLKAHPEEQATAQVSGIKCSRKDWIKCVTEKKVMQEANQEIGGRLDLSTGHKFAKLH
ncbi:uncharacterized protein KIAA1551 homolog isoform X2 [Heterocephalus glaber]|uniref:Uncharacterized protein KIAA1551 homolog isoform X2 n=1 Tax=Heterocephalus glaber TaxID=10181 RepID=A0AAX6PN37_HETGA|nr:uncharacterized protein KIAA1551 homolog isoform X2 [Heterocephalus glaber]